MRSIFLALSICLTPIAANLTSPAYVQAQSFNEAAGDLSKLGAWSAEYNTVMVEMAELFDNPAFNTFLEDILDENVSVEDSEVSLEAWRADHKERMRNLDKSIDNLPPIPAIKDKSLDSIRLGLVEQRKSVRTAAQDLDDMAVKLDEIATKALSGDPSGLDEMSVVLLERAISSIINENATLETSKNSLPDKTHPNYYLMGLMQDSNLFTIEELRILKKSNIGEIGFTARRGNTRTMGRILDGADSRVKLARSSTDKFIKRLRGYSKGLSADSQEGKMINIVITMMESFHDAIDVEEKIIALQRQSLALYQSDMSEEDIDAKTDIIDSAIYELVDQRLALHGERANMAATIGG